MKNLEKCKPLSLERLIDAVRDGFDIDNYFIYGAEDSLTLRKELVCYVDDAPDIDSNDKEVYSAFVKTNKLQMIYSGQQFADVINLAKKQRPSASTADHIHALNYYAENDDFLDL